MTLKTQKLFSMVLTKIHRCDLTTNLTIKQVVTNFFLLIFVITLIGCAPRTQQIGKIKTVPQLFTDSYRTKDGIHLPYKQWGDADAPEAIIIALHGFNDYSNAFKEFGPIAACRNILTIAYDQRGFGNTPEKGIWAGTQFFVQDLLNLTHLLKAKHPNTPLFWMGESMGGAISMIASKLIDEHTLNGIILLAPAVWGWRTMNPFQAGLLFMSAHVLPWMQLTGDGIPVKPSDNEKMLRELGADPLVLKGARIDSLYGLVSLMDDASVAAQHIKHPTLFLYGAKDELVPKHPTRETLRRLPRAPIGKWDTIYYKNGYHMLIRDIKGEKVIKDILAWINKEPYPSFLNEENEILCFSATLQGDIPPLRKD
ncbi:MAG: lysophospholipase [Alphaproteobacteria bacterium]|nr:lysophospholipase [Alphaproteobacteria bacterium]